MIKLYNKYKIYINYFIVSASSFIIDICLFTLFYYLIKNIIISSYIARAISCFINYLLNKYFVFNYKKKSVKSFIEYIILVIANITISAFTVDFISKLLNIKPTFIKVVVDGTLFICNFFVQKLIIFKKKESI